MSTSLLLLTGIFPPDLGGPATFNSKFANWAVENNYQVRVLTYSDARLTRREKDKLKVSSVLRGKYILIRYFLMTAKIIWYGFRSDVVLANGCFIELSFAKIVLNRPLITKIPGDPLWERARNLGSTISDINAFQDEKKGLRENLLRFLTSKSIVSSDFVITPSRQLAQLVTDWGVHPMKIKVIPNAVDTELFSPSLSSDKKFDVVTMARLVPWKGVSELISACGALNLGLAIIGAGPELPSLQASAVESGAQVKFFGSLTQRDSIQVLNEASIFVLNSEYEGFPHALIEAMSLELICIARAGTGCDEIIEDGKNGFLAIPNSPSKSLVHVLREAYQKRLQSKIGVNARLCVINQYNFDTTFQSISKLLRTAGTK
jgi:glycosyltransferase involved in cell wall biosynthesis